MVRFHPFTCHDIECILRSRVGDILAPSASTFIAQKVSQLSGDIRKALEITAGAIAEYKKSASPADLAAIPTRCTDLIKVPHARKAMKNMRDCMASLIEGLPVISRATLCVINTLPKLGIYETTFDKLRRGVSLCLNNCQRIADVVTTGDFEVLLENLRDAGLVQLGMDNEGLSNVKQTAKLTDLPIVLGDPLDEVDKCIEELLSKEDYFNAMREYATNNRGLFEPSKSAGITYKHV
jgi:hypothetical protein